VALATALSGVLLVLALAPAALAQEPSPPEEQEIGRLFTQTAKRGALKPAKGKPRFTLRLRGVAPQVVWFDDRPGRQTGQIPVGGFVRSWAALGFDEVPPNAALTLLDAEDHEDTVVLKLGNPRYERKTRTVRYPARVLDEATGNLSHLEPHRDERVPRRFRAASLFIDDGGYGLPPGCQPGQPYIKCTYTSSTKLDVDSMVSTIDKALPPQQQLRSTTPVWVEAWGGRGANGRFVDAGETYGAFGGYAGYANSVSPLATLSGEELYLYVGQSGSKHANSGGQGGASTIVSTQPLLSIDSHLGGVQVIAGGSGGGAYGCDGRGGDGGVAIASNSPNLDVNGPGESGSGEYAGGGGATAPGGGGSGGAAGGKDDTPGTAGLGGYGGEGKKSSAVGWVDLDAVDPVAAGWTTGAGGNGHAGGGGGYGGGGGAGSCSGGGGGGSWARHLVFTDDLLIFDTDAPFDSKQGDGAQSKVVLTFNLGYDVS
jgi:hypothetical protein